MSGQVPPTRRSSLMKAMPKKSQTWRQDLLAKYQDGDKRDTYSQRVSNFRSNTRARMGRSRETYGEMAGGASKPWTALVIDPRKNTLIGYWDLVSCLALIFTAVVTPYEVGFVPAPSGDGKWGDPLFLMNRVIDLIFVADMLLQFFVATQVTDDRSGTRWVLDSRAIVVNYVTSRWFYLDFFSIGTSAFDLFGTGEASSLSALRVVRALRLVKLVRLARGSRMLTRYEKRLNINYALLGLVQVVVTLLVFCHWSACVWGLQASFHRLNSWMGATGYCEPLPFNGSDVPRAAAEALLANCPAEKACEFKACTTDTCTRGSICEGPSAAYVYALYWAVVTITSVGYGDIHAVPFNTAEQLINTVLVLFGGMLWARLVGTFCGLAAQLEPEVRERRERLSSLNAFMQDVRLPPFLRFRLREYFFEAAHVHKAVKARELLEHVSPALQGEVALTVSSHRLDVVWYLRDVPTVLKIELANRLRPLVLPQGEQAPPGFLYVLERGTVLFSGKVLRAPNVWGLDILLMNEALQLNYAALAISYLWLYVLDADALLHTLEELPRTAQHLESIRFKWACRRMLVRAAEQLQYQRGMKFHGRIRPIYGLNMADGRQTHATTLGRTKGQMGSLEWWDVNDDAAEPVVDLYNKSVGKSFKSSKRANSRNANGTAGETEAERTKQEQMQRAIVVAARLFGANKMRRGQLDDKVRAQEAHLRLQADVETLLRTQNALATTVSEGLRVLSAQVQELAMRQGQGPLSSGPEHIERIVSQEPWYKPPSASAVLGKGLNNSFTGRNNSNRSNTSPASLRKPPPDQEGGDTSAGGNDSGSGVLRAAFPNRTPSKGIKVQAAAPEVEGLDA